MQYLNAKIIIKRAKYNTNNLNHIYLVQTILCS